MDKALIEKAFEKWAEKHKTGVESKRDEVTAKIAFIAGATWQREQLEAENKELRTALIRQSGIRDRQISDLQAVVSSQAKEIEKLKERCEQQIWNLGGVSTLLLGYSIDEFNKEYALPALLDTNEFVKKHKDLQSKLDEAVNIIKTISKNANHYDKIDLQNKAEKFLSSLDKIKEEL